MAVAPYQITVPDEVLADLRDRLGRTRWPDAVTPGWEYGADVAYLRELCGYWADGFDWRAQEQAINEYSHFRAQVDGVGVHFLHERAATGAGGSDSSPAMPLLLLHGWPSSFLQMLKILPLLTSPGSFGADEADAFDVVVPSLPDPEAVLGLHMSGPNPFMDLENLPADLSPAEQQMVADARRFRTEEFAYALLHVSKPQTPAVGLSDSPAGLAAWIVEKYRNWSDCGGDVERVFSKDELLANLTVYWATGTIASSMRLYYENFHAAGGWGQLQAPVALAMLPADMFRTPREWMERQGGFARFTELPRGGHFGEQEVPDLLAEDLREFLRPLRGG